MEIIQLDLNKDYSEAIQKTIAVLNSGGIVVYPTDTLYALGANALDANAVERVFKIKERSFSKPLPIAVKNLIWAKELVRLTREKERIASKLWPGKFTLIFDKKEIVPDIVTSGNRSLAMRVPDSIFVDKLLGKYGYPITITSANISGENPSGDINKIIEIFNGRRIKPDLIIDAGILPKSELSVVMDITGDKPKILRVGPSSPKQLMKLLNI